MTKEKLEKAKQLEARINHVDRVIRLLVQIHMNKGRDIDDIKAMLRENGLIPNPDEVAITQNDIDVMLNAFNKEHYRLQQEFYAL